MNSKTLKEKHEIPTDYIDAKKQYVAVDCIIFGFDLNEVKILLFKRLIEPLKDKWSLIGRFLGESECLDNAASRVLFEYTGLQDIYLNQLHCYSDPVRDPGGRVISVSYYALIKLDKTKLLLTSKFQAKWFDLNQKPSLILDHDQMVKDALDKLREVARQQPIGFELLPEKFTIPQLQLLYESLFGHKIDSRNFRKKILGQKILTKLDVKDFTNSKKGAYFYSFDVYRYNEKLKDGFIFSM